MSSINFALNILVFIVLVFIALSKVTSIPPQNSNRQNQLITFLLGSGLFFVGGAFLYGMNISALRMMIYILIIALCIMLYKGQKKNMGFLGFLYIIFLIYSFSRISESPSFMYGIRNFLKYLYPFLVYLLALKAVQINSAKKWLTITFYGGLFFMLFSSGFSEKIPYLAYNPIWSNIFWARATFADFGAMNACVGLALIMFIPEKKKFYLFASALFVISSVIVFNRTGILASLTGFALFSIGRFKILALPFIVGAILLAASAFVFIDTLKEQTFRGNATSVNTLSDLKNMDSTKIDSSGRFYMWEKALEKFYESNKNFGSGIGSLQYQFYEKGGLLEGSRLKVIHGDYITFLCDLGLVGLVLFCLFPLVAILKGFKASFSNNKEIRISGILVMAIWAACLTSMGFDNVINYAFATTTYSFAFTGMLVGLTQLYKKQRENELIKATVGNDNS